MIILLSYAASPLADSPVGTSVIANAVLWIQGVLLGKVATTVAIIAVATIGFGMLAGRVDVRRGVTIITGCFILFGASSIVSGLQSAMTDSAPVDWPEPTQPVVSQPVVASPPPRPSGYDPYAGASVPTP